MNESDALDLLYQFAIFMHFVGLFRPISYHSALVQPVSEVPYKSKLLTK